MNSTTSSCSFACKMSWESFSRSASVFACHTLLSRSSRQNRRANCCHSSALYGALRVKHTDLRHPAPPQATTLCGPSQRFCKASSHFSVLRKCLKRSEKVKKVIQSDLQYGSNAYWATLTNARQNRLIRSSKRALRAVINAPTMIPTKTIVSLLVFPP